MFRRIRALLCCLAALALPLQAMAHDALGACHGRGAAAAHAAAPGDDPHAFHGAGPARGAGHGMHDAASVRSDVHHGHAAGASLPLDEVGPAAGVAPDATGSDAGCPLCATCSVASALPPGDGATLPSAGAGGTWSAGPAAPVTLRTVAGPERPPRSRTL